MKNGNCKKRDAYPHSIKAEIEMLFITILAKCYHVRRFVKQHGDHGCMKKKRNKKAIIITAIVMLTGILLVLAGFFGGWFLSLFSKEFDYKNIQPEDLGKTVRTDVVVIYDDIDIEDKVLQALGDTSFDDDYAFILLDLSALSEKDKKMYYSMTSRYITIQRKRVLRGFYAIV